MTFAGARLSGATPARIVTRRGALRHVLVAMSAWTLFGCGGGNEALVRDEAAADLNCDERAIRVTYMGNEHYEAVGCGQRERYAFHDRDHCPNGRCPFQH